MRTLTINPLKSASAVLGTTTVPAVGLSVTDLDVSFTGLPRGVSVTLGEVEGAYTVGSKITVTGTNIYGEPVSEEFTVDEDSVDGGVTYYGTVGFIAVDSVTVEAQADEGSVTVGIAAVIIPSLSGLVAVRVTDDFGGNLVVGYSNGVKDKIWNVTPQTLLPISPTQILGDTSVGSLTLYFQ